MLGNLRSWLEEQSDALGSPWGHQRGGHGPGKGHHQLRGCPGLPLTNRGIDAQTNPRARVQQVLEKQTRFKNPSENQLPKPETRRARRWAGAARRVPSLLCRCLLIARNFPFPRHCIILEVLHHIPGWGDQSRSAGKLSPAPSGFCSKPPEQPCVRHAGDTACWGHGSRGQQGCAGARAVLMQPSETPQGSRELLFWQRARGWGALALAQLCFPGCCLLVYVRRDFCQG